jgi:hypothetical protein
MMKSRIRGVPWWAGLMGLLSAVGCRGAQRAEAQAALAEALSGRDPARVAAAAQAAAPHQGEDPALDRLLGDALANILMRPDEGLSLLLEHPDPGDPAWRAAAGAAALRTGRGEVVGRVAAEARLGDVDEGAPAIPWLGRRALSDPAIGFADLRALLDDCALLDDQPDRGRAAIDAPLPPGLVPVARALGADRVVLGRARAPADPAPESGRGRPPCHRGVLLDVEPLESPLPRHAVLALAGAAPPFSPPLYLSLTRGPDGGPWVLGSTRPDDAQALLRRALEDHPEEP